MSWLHRCALGAGIVCALGAGGGLAQDLVFLPSSSAGSVASGHIVVKVDSDALKASLGAWSRMPRVRLERLLGVPFGCRLEETAFTLWKKTKERGARALDSDDLDVDQFMYLRLRPGLTPESCVEQMQKRKWVKYAEVDPIGTAAAVYPTDPDFVNGQEWHVRDTGPNDHIHATEAWGITTGSSNILVAVLDSGVNTNLLEFTGRTVAGYNFAGTNLNTADDHGHGTAVAGILCASANNGTNIAGIDWRCRLMPVKVLRSDGSGMFSWWADGIRWAVTNGAKVINLSAGNTNGLTSTNLSSAIDFAVAHGCIFITATHNNGLNNVAFPGTHSNAISVGATTNTGARWAMSNYGTNIALVAPGAVICTVRTNGTRTFWSGTSFATPIVSGVALLICSIWPGVNQEQMRALLCAGADDRVSADPLDTPGYDKYYGWGRVNAYNSLVLAQTEIARIARTNAANVALGWRCPPNAGTNQPFQVQYASTLTGMWSVVSNVTYAGTNATWVDTNAVAGTRFYRVVLHEYRNPPP